MTHMREVEIEEFLPALVEDIAMVHRRELPEPSADRANAQIPAMLQALNAFQGVPAYALQKWFNPDPPEGKSI